MEILLPFDENPEWSLHVDEPLNENRYPLYSVLREIQETDCGDLADLAPLVAVAGELERLQQLMPHRPPKKVHG
jgi:hypothetical protein